MRGLVTCYTMVVGIVLLYIIEILRESSADVAVGELHT